MSHSLPICASNSDTGGVYSPFGHLVIYMYLQITKLFRPVTWIKQTICIIHAAVPYFNHKQQIWHSRLDTVVTMYKIYLFSALIFHGNNPKVKVSKSV